MLYEENLKNTLRNFKRKGLLNNVIQVFMNFSIPLGK